MYSDSNFYITTQQSYGISTTVVSLISSSYYKEFAVLFHSSKNKEKEKEIEDEIEVEVDAEKQCGK